MFSNKEHKDVCSKLMVKIRSIRPEVFCEKVFLKITQNLQENNCARVSNNKDASLWNFIKNETLSEVFPVNFTKFL